MTQPTPDQLTRAAELAPKVCEIADIPFAKWPGHTPEILHIGNFQRIVLALPEDVYRKAVQEAWDSVKEQGSSGWDCLRWLLTPRGMLEIYEALVSTKSVD